jgi:hypothetical protein
MSFELLCATLIALLFGAAICFGGYRLFLLLLPIWGFFFGFGLGAQTIQLVLGEGFLGSITSWVVGFIVAIVFAILAYLFYVVAVAIIAGSLGYGLGVAIMGLFSADLNILTWVVGIVLAIIAIVLTFRFNLAKVVIIIVTAVGGAAICIGSLTLGAGERTLVQLSNNPIQTMLDGSFIWTVLFIVLALAGIVLQWTANRSWEIDYYNRLEATA